MRRGAKAYLTLNIIVYDEELETVRNLCAAAKPPEWTPSSLPIWR